MSREFLRSIDGRKQPALGEVAVYWPNVDCTYIYDTNGFEFTDEPEPESSTYPELIEHDAEATALEMRIALQDVTAELSQMHSHYHPACEGGCPTVEYIMNARKAIAKSNGA